MFVPRLGKGPRDQAFDCGPDRESVRENDRRFDRSELLHLRRAGKLAERIADKYSSRHLLLKQVAVMREERGHTSANAVAGDQRDVADLHARNVCDCVERAWLQDAGCDTEFARARTILGGGALLRHKHDERGGRDELSKLHPEVPAMRGVPRSCS